MKPISTRWLRFISLTLILALLLPSLALAEAVGASASDEVIDMDAVNYTGTHRVTASSLRVRSGPGSNYSIIGYVYRNERVQVTSVGGDFSRITMPNGRTGYASNDYLTPVSTSVTPTPRQTPKPTSTSGSGLEVYRVTASSLNMRRGPGTSYSKVTMLTRNQLVYNIGVYNSTWMKVRTMAGLEGYVSRDYITYSYTAGTETDKPTAIPTRTTAPTRTTPPTDKPTATAQPGKPGLGPGDIYEVTGSVNFRTGPSTSYPITDVLLKGDYVTLISKYSSAWYHVRDINGQLGYLSRNYIKYVRTASGFETPAPSSSPTSKPTDVVDTSKQVYSYAQMRADLSKLQKMYPGQLTIYRLGDDTYWGDQIPAVMVGSNSAPHSLLINAAIHGREYMSTLLVMKQLEYILANQGKTYNGYTYAELLKSCNILLVPMINPDGVYISQYGVGSMTNQSRKEYLIDLNNGSTSFKRWKANGRGVDLNRNFSAGWVKKGSASSEGYSGTRAFSESESSALMEFVNMRKRIGASINYHTVGNHIYWNYKQTGSQLRRDKKIADQLSRITGYPLLDPGVGSYGGGFMDWMIAEKKLPSFTIELGSSSTNAPQPISAFSKIWNANKDVPAYMLWYLVTNG